MVKICGKSLTENEKTTPPGVARECKDARQGWYQVAPKTLRSVSAKVAHPCSNESTSVPHTVSVVSAASALIAGSTSAMPSTIRTMPSTLLPTLSGTRTAVIPAVMNSRALTSNTQPRSREMTPIAIAAAPRATMKKMSLTIQLFCVTVSTKLTRATISGSTKAPEIAILATPFSQLTKNKQLPDSANLNTKILKMQQIYTIIIAFLQIKRYNVESASCFP